MKISLPALLLTSAMTLPAYAQEHPPVSVSFDGWIEKKTMNPVLDIISATKNDQASTRLFYKKLGDNTVTLDSTFSNNTHALLTVREEERTAKDALVRKRVMSRSMPSTSRETFLNMEMTYDTREKVVNRSGEIVTAEQARNVKHFTKP